MNVTKDLKQKARVKWATEGNENRNFFHVIAKERKRKNTMRGLLINGVWTKDPSTLKRRSSITLKNNA